VAFTDGAQIGAMLDRNGLRPAKYAVTSDGLVVLASEFGVLPLDPARVVQKGRVQPGKMFLVDTDSGRVISDEEIKHHVATQKPYREWLEENRLTLSMLPEATSPYKATPAELRRQQQAFGYTEEDLKMILGPMAVGAEEPTGSMGVDTPLAVLSERPQLLFRYFKQQFAQVTNPPIDPIREETVMSLVSCVGGEGNLLEETPKQCRMLELPHPFLSNDDMARLRRNILGDFRTCTLRMSFPVAECTSPERAGRTLRHAIDRLCKEAVDAIDGGASLIILSDRGISDEQAPIPSLLATSAVHHHLIRSGRRVRAGLVIETAEPREVSHMCLLIGFGAGALNPYLALDSLPDDRARANYIKALKKGLLKTMSKMGISAVASYQGAQIFEAVGIDQMVIDNYFTGAVSRVRGVGMPEIAEETLARHARAFSRNPERELDVGGQHMWRTTGEAHLWTPKTVAKLQEAVRLDDANSYDEYARLINDQSRRLMTLRGMWDLLPAGPEVAIENVESAASIVKRFTTGAMSFGSISKEAHENLAIAMNRIGG
ncbi:MAG: glutamate synthase central domain-containing protein, partial [Polyangia bacterium]